MRAVVSRVTAAAVTVDSRVVGALPGPGLLVLLGVTHSDDAGTALRMAGKIAGLRILRGSDGAADDASASDLGAPVLVVSQFTLYGDTRRGRRPGWSAAAPGPVAEPLVAAVVDALRAAGLAVSTGVFGASMAVTSTNDGPFTLVLDVSRRPGSPIDLPCGSGGDPGTNTGGGPVSALPRMIRTGRASRRGFGNE